MVAKQRTVLWESISREYWEQSDHEAKQLDDIYKSFLQRGLTSESTLKVLDIGAGFAGYDILLAQKYKHLNLTILDASDEDQEFKLGFQKVAEKYNDFNVLDFLFLQSHIRKERYELIDFRGLDIQTWVKQRVAQYDVIQSLFSWCFHYPYDVYRDAAQLLLKPGGILIVDCRNTDDQLDAIKENFQYLGDVHAACITSDRVIFRQPMP
ncbi:class I SAM-dependent methyltransferase [Synechococcus sp. KORDI-100]|uniref:class I SAM-dependent methyltransferase n=1 Tax=Synechococcus sp. KORDI-100 TaxID=1280380 RepID=UPI0012E06E29|nr:class I SAM-dependent methyltransferase [Synechococcus sp. KORDI-100]